MYIFKHIFLTSAGNPILIQHIWTCMNAGVVLWTMFSNVKIPISHSIKTWIPDPLLWLIWNSNIFISQCMTQIPNIRRLLEAIDERALPNPGYINVQPARIVHIIYSYYLWWNCEPLYEKSITLIKLAKYSTTVSSIFTHFIEWQHALWNTGAQDYWVKLNVIWDAEMQHISSNFICYLLTNLIIYWTAIDKRGVKYASMKLEWWSVSYGAGKPIHMIDDIIKGTLWC